MWRRTSASIFGAGLYVENWELATKSVDYLAADKAASPVQHYWSLSVEEQFYVVWPLLLGTMLAGRSRRPGSTVVPRAVFTVLAVGVVASLAYSLWVSATNPAWAYFVTPARAWEFGAGRMAGVRAAGRGAPSRPRPDVVGLGRAGGPADLCPGPRCEHHDAGHRGHLGGGRVRRPHLGRGPGLAWSSDRLLTLRPAQYLGDISYSVYLWHWPLIILLPYITEHALTGLDRGSILLATVGLAALTKRWVEDPVRSTRNFGLRRPLVTFAYAATAAALLAVLCLVPRQDVARQVERTERAAAALASKSPRCFGAQSRDPRVPNCPNPILVDTIVPSPEAAKDDYPRDERCHAPNGADPIQPCQFGDPRAGVPHLAVIGDSHARVLMYMLQPLVDAGLITVDAYLASGCAWSTAPPNPNSSYDGCASSSSAGSPREWTRRRPTTTPSSPPVG